jgi:uroporphyrinogen decarboxylase
MTSRERFLKVLRGEMPDRVPVTLFMYDQGHFLAQNYPDVDPWDFETWQVKSIELQKQFGADVYVRLLGDVIDPNIIYGGLDVSRETENWEVRTEEKREGNNLVRRSTISTPGGELTQDFTITAQGNGTYVHACTKKPIASPADLEIAKKYEPGPSEEYKRKVKQRIAAIKAALGEDGIIGTWGPHGPFNVASLLINHEDLYSLFIVEPEFYNDLMEFALERSRGYISAIDEAGTDIHCIGGNVPGGFLGKPSYDEYILPYEKQLIAHAQKNGTPGMYHNCGEIMNLVESYKELGVVSVEPFSPPPLGDVADLAEAKRRSGGKYVMLSGIDQVNVLQKGTVDQTKRITEEAMKIGKEGGKFIMQPVDFLEYGTPVENVTAYVETALQFAEY